MHTLAPEPANKRDLERISRAEIARAVPAGSRRATRQRDALRAGLSLPDLAEVRADFRANLEAFWQIHVYHASWGGRGQAPRGITAPTRAKVCAVARFSTSTYKACRRWWQAYGFLAIVRHGRTPALKPMALTGPDDANERQVYVLCTPRADKSQTITRPLSRLRSSPDRAPARGKDPNQKRARSAGTHSRAAAPRPPHLHRGPFNQITEGWWAKLTGPFAKFSSDDLAWAVDHEPGGAPHRHATASIRHPVAWLRYRLSLWLRPDGSAMPSRSEQIAAATTAERAETRRQLAERAAAAAAATTNAAFWARMARMRMQDAARRAARPERTAMRIAMDSVSFAAVGELDWADKIGYINGRISAWSAAEIAETRARGQLLALVDVLGTQPREASVLDWERGDVQSPAVLRAWVQARNQFRGDAAVYCSVNSIPVVVAALAGERCNLWVVALTDNGEPPLEPPSGILGQLPAHVKLIGIQFVLGPRSGGNYDLSVFYADDWHPDKEDEPQAVAAVTTGGQLEPADLELAAPGSSSAANLTVSGAPMPPPFAPPSSPDPAAADVGQAAELGPVSDHPFQVITRTDVDQAADVAGAALVASTAPSSATPAPGIQHNWAGAILRDVGIVAEQFRRAGASSTAALLEQAVEQAIETGRLLKAAGL
jgi:hypothetical protein